MLNGFTTTKIITFLLPIAGNQQMKIIRWYIPKENWVKRKYNVCIPLQSFKSIFISTYLMFANRWICSAKISRSCVIILGQSTFISIPSIQPTWITVCGTRHDIICYKENLPGAPTIAL